MNFSEAFAALKLLPIVGYWTIEAIGSRDGRVQLRFWSTDMGQWVDGNSFEHLVEAVKLAIRFPPQTDDQRAADVVVTP